jgi:hypothetical protein
VSELHAFLSSVVPRDAHATTFVQLVRLVC